KKKNVNKILDIGCGAGRHTIYFAAHGFKMYAMDSAPSGIRRAKENLKKYSLSAKFRCANCYEPFPYKDDFFDAVISTQVIHHAKIENINFCVSEIQRVLRAGGLAFVTVTKCKYHKEHKVHMKKIAPRTFVHVDGVEKGVPHYIFTQKELRKAFHDFKILDIHTDKKEHIIMLGQLKNSNRLLSPILYLFRYSNSIEQQ
ncbi:MAG: class I SAM-dependent methyltransferase, partial [Nanoarchaeota archaeon]|nr:class I SAM-dependent methyltransferase [Nanoarchaeota archaeon]